MKYLFVFCAAWLAWSGALADNHESQPQVLYGQSYNIVATNPAGVVEALKAYRSSPTGKQMASTVTLSQNVANGDQPATHVINVFYPSTAAMDDTARLASGSDDAAKFGASMRDAASLESENVFSVLRSKINRENMENPATMLFALKVTDQAAFMKALNKIFASDAAAAFPGGMFFGQVIAMGANETTHWVSFQAPSVGTLLTAVDAFMKSDDFAAYAKNADDFREVTARLISRQLLTLAP